MTTDAQEHDQLRKHLLDELEFQTRWRGLMMISYSFTVAGAIVAGSLATLLAALELSTLAAAAAATGTVLLGLEKGLLFRERWKLHALISTRLSNLQLDYDTSSAEQVEAIHRLKAVRLQYAEELPTEGRTDR